MYVYIYIYIHNYVYTHVYAAHPPAHAPVDLVRAPAVQNLRAEKHDNDTTASSTNTKTIVLVVIRRSNSNDQSRGSPLYRGSFTALKPEPARVSIFFSRTIIINNVHNKLFMS